MGAQQSSGSSVNQLQGRKSSAAKSSSGRSSCKCCGRRNHTSSECRFKEATCHKCHQKGHIKPVCPRAGHEQSLSSTKYRSKLSAKHIDLQVNSDIDNSDCSDSDGEQSYGLYNVGAKKNKGNSPYLVTVYINDCEVTMEVDTGASRSTISEEV